MLPAFSSKAGECGFCISRACTAARSSLGHRPAPEMNANYAVFRVQGLGFRIQGLGIRVIRV